MSNIIQHFVKNVMDLEEKSLKNLNNLDFLADFTTNLNEELMNLGKEITLNMIDFLEEKIYNSSERKNKYVVYQKNSLSNERKLITIFGEIIFNRRYYASKEENVDKRARLRVLAANKENIKIITRNRNNKQIREKEEKQNKVRKMIKIEGYKREDGIIYTIPEIQCGDCEIGMKIKELIKCKAI